MHLFIFIYLFSIHRISENLSPTLSPSAGVISPRGETLTRLSFSSLQGIFWTGRSGGRVHSLQVIVHCVHCSAVMDSLSMRRPCSLSEHVLNNRFHFQCLCWAGSERWKCRGAKSFKFSFVGCACAMRKEHDDTQ